ncbi:MAG: glycosyltransferase family 4 protein [Candidatus Magasanikbacteria bacterium]|nr:glycosyltransferase family 4 protein [Candidatus Magasanikbacteria bacterium]
MKRTILAFCPIFYPHMGGAERTVFELFSRLIKRHGYTVHLVTINTENAPAYEFLSGIHVYRIGKSYSNKVIKFLMFQWFFAKLYFGKLYRTKFDIFNVHYAFPLSIFSILFALFSKKLLVVTEYHFGLGSEMKVTIDNPADYYQHHPKYINYVSGLVYKLADFILTISEDNKKFIQRYIGSANKVVVIKQGTDQVFFAPSFFSPVAKAKLARGHQFVCVTTSRISPRKNLLDMVAVIGYLRGQNCDVILLINGTPDRNDQSYFTELKNSVATAGLTEYIIFNNFVTDEELRVIYACADLFFLTSKSEGFGIVNVEALASGTPVITYDTGAAKDFIVNGSNGYITQNNPQSFAEIARQVLTDANLLKQMRHNARACVERELNWDHYADRTHDYLAQLSHR